MTDKSNGIKQVGDILGSLGERPRPEPSPCVVCGKPVEPRFIAKMGWLVATRHSECPYTPPGEVEAEEVTRERVRSHQLAAGFVAPEIDEAFAALSRQVDAMTMPTELLEFGVDDRYALHIEGPTHSGKTSRVIIWAALYLKRVRCSKSMVYTTERELIDAVSYSRTRESTPLRDYYEPDVLIIDECGRKEGRAWGADEFVEIIVQRARRQNLTITIGQCSLDDLGERSTLWEESVLHRLRRGSKGVHVKCEAFEGGRHE